MTAEETGTAATSQALWNTTVNCEDLQLIQLTQEDLSVPFETWRKSKYFPFEYGRLAENAKALLLCSGKSASLEMVAADIAANLSTGRRYFCLSAARPLRVCILTDKETDGDSKALREYYRQNWEKDGWTPQQIMQAEAATHFTFWQQDKRSRAAVLQQLDSFRQCCGFELIILTGTANTGL